MSYLPSKKVRVVALVVLIILVGFFWYVGKQSNQNQTSKNSLIYTNPKVLAQKEQEKKLVEFIEAKITEQGGLQNTNLSDLEPKVVFTDKDISISSDNSVNNLKKYGLNVNEALNQLREINPQEANLVIKAVAEQDQIQIINLEKRSGEFHQTINILASTTVPSTASTIHLTLINSLAHLANLLDQMSLALEEPVVALQAAKAYSVDSIEFYNVLNQINQFFTDNKVTFSEEELAPVEQTSNQ